MNKDLSKVLGCVAEFEIVNDLDAHDPLFKGVLKAYFDKQTPEAQRFLAEWTKLRGEVLTKILAELKKAIR